MAVPWFAVGKLVLTNLDSIMTVVKPVFTKNKGPTLPNQTDLLAQQIAELQAAASGNAERINQLAVQLKEIVHAVEQSASRAASERDTQRTLCLVSLGVSLGSILAVVMLVVLR